MPYGRVRAAKHGRRITIEVDLPEAGEPSHSGRAENLTDPRAWEDLEDEDGQLGIKVTVCRPYARRCHPSR